MDKRPKSSSEPWTTDSEIKWLNEIGDELEREKNKNRSVDNRILIDRADLLRGYLISAKKRSRWGKMDRTVCIKHAQDLLKRLESQEKPT